MPKKRVLVLTPRFPFPAIGGDRIRILHVCRALARDYELTLLSLCETHDEMHIEPRDSMFAEIHRVRLPRWRSFLSTALALPTSRPLQLAYYQSGEFRRMVDELAPKHDLVVAHLIRTGQYVEHLLAPRVLEMTDAISMNYQRVRATGGKRSWKHLVYAVEESRLRRYEMGVVRRFDRVWLTSNNDRAAVDPNQECAVEVIPNGADLESLPYAPPLDDGNAVVFIGNMTTLQNQDACEYFAREILPLVRSHIPEVVFRIVGNAPQSVCDKFANIAGVETTGRLDRIQDGVRGAFCGVCPVRAAAGIQNKVLEYMALGLPCVTSPLGLGPIDARNGIELLVYNSREEAAQQIVTLHRNRLLRLGLSSAGRALVERRYDWKKIYPRFVDSSTKLLGVPHRIPEAA
jgi:glycosyltransferase involved in cell wall biosynthesis